MKLRGNKAACEKCRVGSEFIERLPGKYGTFLGRIWWWTFQEGRKKQRLALARITLKKKKPKFMILDEATSNLDFISEAKIFNTLFKKGRNITMLIRDHKTFYYKRL